MHSYKFLITVLTLSLSTNLLVGCQIATNDNKIDETTKKQETLIEREPSTEISNKRSQEEDSQNLLEVGQIIKGMELTSIEPIMTNRPLDQWDNARFTFEGSKSVKGVFEKQTTDTCDNMLFIVTEDADKLPLSERDGNSIAICINNLNRQVEEGEEAILELKKYTGVAANFGPISPYAEIK